MSHNVDISQIYIPPFIPDFAYLSGKFNHTIMSKIIPYFTARFRSFGYAFKGIYTLFATQPNAQIHLLAVGIISAMGWYLGLSTLEWCAILICMAMVLLAEGINTAIEFIVDLVSPDFHPLAGKAKDVGAGAVLLSVIFCGIVWGIIYIPKIIIWWNG